MNGWVALHRQLSDHPLWLGERFTRGQAWVDLILMTSYADHLAFQGNRPIQVRRGQILTSQVKLAARWRWNRETVRAFLRLLESAKMAAIQTSKATDTGYTLVTLLNYDLYQGSGEEMKALPSGIPSAIETPFEPASNQHPTATINKGNKGNKNTADARASAGKALKRNGAGRKARKTDPETDTLLQEFASAFQAKLSEPYLIEWGRDRKCMGGLVATYGPASVRAKLAAFFEHGTRETRERRAWTVPEFRRVFPKLVAMQAMGDL
jgi:hypothetical protein